MESGQKQGDYIKVNMDDFFKIYNKMSVENKELVLIFKGSENEKGENWCSDCVTAEPHIKKTLIPLCEEKSLSIIECSVGDRATWKNPQHPLRTNKLFALTGVPTILYILNNKVHKRLVEELCASDEMLIEFIQS